MKGDKTRGVSLYLSSEFFAREEVAFLETPSRQRTRPEKSQSDTQVHDVRQSAIVEEVNVELDISSCSLGTTTHVFALPMLQASSIQKQCFLELRSQNPTSQIT